MAAPFGNDAFAITRQGSITILTPMPQEDGLYESSMDHAAAAVLSQLDANSPKGLILDLSHLRYMNSMLLSLLLRFHKRVKQHNGQVVVAGAADAVRELLILTSLDTIWPMYQTNEEALAAIEND